MSGLTENTNCVFSFEILFKTDEAADHARRIHDSLSSWVDDSFADEGNEIAQIPSELEGVDVNVMEAIIEMVDDEYPLLGFEFYVDHKTASIRSCHDNDGYSRYNQAAYFAQILLCLCDTVHPYVLIDYAIINTSRSSALNSYGSSILVTKDKLFYRPPSEEWAEETYREYEAGLIA